MKPHPALSRRIAIVRLSGLVLAVATTSYLPLTGAPNEPAASAATASKPYTLFAGADFAVEWKGQLRPVVGVDQQSFVVEVDGRRLPVPPTQENLRIKVDAALKVTPHRVTVADLKAEPAYTPANDPNRRIAEAIGNVAAAAADLDAAAANLDSAERTLGWATAMHYDASELAPKVLGARNELMQQSAAQGAAANLLIDAGTRAGVEAAQEQYDALRIDFQMSAPTPLAHPYVILAVRYRKAGDSASPMRLWVYPQSLDNIGPKPKRIRLAAGGFPPGYTLEGVQVHVYDQGAELASNVARKRVELTADEALQFAIVEYIQQHRGATLEPALMSGAVEAARSRLSGAQLGQTYYVKVGTDGKPVGVFADQACATQIADPALAATLNALRFNPALKDGKPIAGVATVRL